MRTAFRHAYGFGLAIACCVVASLAAVAAHFLVRATAFVADQQPETFLLLAFAVCLWALVRWVFRRRVEY